MSVFKPFYSVLNEAEDDEKNKNTTDGIVDNDVDDKKDETPEDDTTDINEPEEYDVDPAGDDDFDISGIDDEEPEDDTADNNESEENTDNNDSTDDDFDINIDGSEGGDDQSSDGGDTGDGSSSDVTEDINNDLIAKEKEIFSGMSDKQIEIKNKELKTNYVNLHDYIEDIMYRINHIPKQSYNIQPLAFVMDKLTQMQDTLADYLSNTYITKTYIENTIYYEKCLAILNTINEILKKLTPNTEK